MGQKIAAYNTAGAITAFYDSSDSPPPTGIATLNITDAQWQTCLSQPGWTVSGGALVAPAAPTAAQLLAAAQASASVAIDQQAGQTRLKYITDVSGQADTYTQKGAEASAYKAAGYPFANLASYPWTQAEAIAINGPAPTAAQTQAAADGILSTQAAWVAKGAAIEQARRAGKIAVGAATTVAGIKSAQAAALTALQAL